MALPPDAACTWDDVVTIAKELASVPDTSQTEFLRMVAYQVPVAQWGGKQKVGQMYLAAHLATVSRRRGDGPTTQRSEGQISASYADMMQAGPLGTTSYGVEFERLIRILPRIAFGFVS